MEEQKIENGRKEVKRLYRSRRVRSIGGVCGGIAEYFEVDVAIIRILFVLLALIKGIGLLVYLIALFIVPLNPNQAEVGEKSKPTANRSQGVILVIGILLVLIGLYYVMENFFYFPDYMFYTFPFRWHWELFWPLLLILIGVLYLIHVSQKGKEMKTTGKEKEQVATESRKRLTRSRKERKIAGVCGGLAAYFEIDPTIIRVIWVILTIFFGALFLGIIAYIVMAIVVPEESEESAPGEKN